MKISEADTCGPLFNICCIRGSSRGGSKRSFCRERFVELLEPEGLQTTILQELYPREARLH